MRWTACVLVAAIGVSGVRLLVTRPEPEGEETAARLRDEIAELKRTIRQIVEATK